MKILHLTGEELVKEKPNTSEDFFNRSTAVYLENGKEKALELLYVRYFDEQLAQQSGYEHENVLQVNNRSFSVKELAALAALLADERFKEKRKAYINEFAVFSSLFDDENVNKLKDVLVSLQNA